jgi:hypothetical protein
LGHKLVNGIGATLPPIRRWQQSSFRLTSARGDLL